MIAEVFPPPAVQNPPRSWKPAAGRRRAAEPRPRSPLAERPEGAGPSPGVAKRTVPAPHRLQRSRQGRALSWSRWVSGARAPETHRDHESPCARRDRCDV